MFSLLMDKVQLSSIPSYLDSDEMITIILPDASLKQVQEGLMNVYLYNNCSALLNYLGITLPVTDDLSDDKIDPKNISDIADLKFKDQSFLEESSMNLTIVPNQQSLNNGSVTRKTCE